MKMRMMLLVKKHEETLKSKGFSTIKIYREVVQPFEHYGI